MIWREQSEGKKAVLTAGHESGGGLGTGTAGRAQGAEKSCRSVRRRQQAGVESQSNDSGDGFLCPVCAGPAAVSAQLGLLLIQQVALI